jgi:hypothetical protein
MNSSYYRVIPRDLFNEGKLLTELGFLSLAILDNKEGINKVLALELIDEEEGFIVTQDEDDGSLFVSNLICTISKDGSECQLYTQLNCRDRNALRFKSETLGVEGVVFNKEDYSSEFRSFLQLLT